MFIAYINVQLRVHIYQCTLTSSAVECIDMLKVTGREPITLPQRVERNTGIHRDNRWLPVAGECKRTIVHDGSQVVGYTLCGHERRADCLKIALNT